MTILSSNTSFIWPVAVIAIQLQIKSYTRTLKRLDKLTLSLFYEYASTK